MAEQEPTQDAQDPVSESHKMIGVAVTWAAEQIFFLPALSGAARQKSQSFTPCTAKALGPSDASLQALVCHATRTGAPRISKIEIVVLLQRPGLCWAACWATQGRRS